MKYNIRCTFYKIIYIYINYRYDVDNIYTNKGCDYNASYCICTGLRSKPLYYIGCLLKLCSIII